jgi:hypothetical protein
VPTRSILALSLLVGVQSVWINPVAVAADLRALACCTHDCDGPVSVPSARQCCGVALASSGPAEGPVARTVPQPAVLALPVLGASPSSAGPADPTSGAVPYAGAGPPLFLAQQRLLI